MTTLKANIAFPTRYRFGAGRRAELPGELKAAGIARPLVVTDPGVRAQEWFAEVAGAARVFDGVEGNPTEENVLAGVRAFEGCDGIVAIGGGSAMDAAKVIGAIAANGGTVVELAGRKRAIERMVPLVAMPTTAGTGSEVSTGAVVTDHVAKVKRTILHPLLMPKAVIADPETTAALPAEVTAATGMDALTHAMEALFAPGYHPMCDAIAYETIAMIFAWLERAVLHDGEARAHMMMAASMAAVAFQKGLGLVHAMAHPLGAVANVHHGLANAVLLPHVIEHNTPAIRDKCNRLSPGHGDSVERVAESVRQLGRTIGLPDRLPVSADADELARLALDEKLYLATNPQPTTPAHVAAIYRLVLTSAAS